MNSKFRQIIREEISFVLRESSREYKLFDDIFDELDHEIDDRKFKKVVTGFNSTVKYLRQRGINKKMAEIVAHHFDNYKKRQVDRHTALISLVDELKQYKR